MKNIDVDNLRKYRCFIFIVVTNQYLQSFIVNLKTINYICMNLLANIVNHSSGQSKSVRYVLLAFICFFSFVMSLSVRAQKAVIPDTKEYKVLKCDLHLHTVMSDGLVWPTVRVDEAAAEGLDAIAITDHLEYRPIGKKMSDMSLNHAYDEAKQQADKKKLLLVKAVEITRGLPGGNLNALFLNDIDALDKYWNRTNWQSNEGLKDALLDAKNQGAYVFWCHPWWPNADNKPRWTDVNEDFFKEGLFKGIEIKNGRYSPEAYRWATDKELTIFGNTDAHGPVKLSAGNYRDITLVFAKNRSIDALREALLDGRTMVLAGNLLYGKEALALSLLESCLSYTNALIDEHKVEVIITNKSTIGFKLSRIEKTTFALSASNIEIPPMGSVVLTLTGSTFKRGEKYMIPVQFDTIYLTPDTHLVYQINFTVR